MKMVIYKSYDGYRTTSERNYNSYVQNARSIYTLHGCTDLNDAINCVCRNFKVTENEIIIAPNAYNH